MNKHKILTVLSLIVIYIVVYFIVNCAWVGAEYVFEGAVHTSYVDGSIAAMLTYYITLNVYRLNRKYGGKTK